MEELDAPLTNAAEQASIDNPIRVRRPRNQLK